MLQTEEEVVAAAKGERRKELFFNWRQRRTVGSVAGQGAFFLSETAAAGEKCHRARRGPVGSGVGGKARQRPVGNDAGQGAAIEIGGGRHHRDLKTAGATARPVPQRPQEMRRRMGGP
jgi:hypothetical protein